MSDRIYSYTVILDGTYKDEGEQAIRNALEMVKGVSSVVPLVTDPMTYFAIDRAKNDIADKIMDILYPRDKK